MHLLALNTADVDRKSHPENSPPFSECFPAADLTPDVKAYESNLQQFVLCAQ